MVDHLTVGPYSIPLLPLYAGPVPQLKKGALEEPLAAVVNYVFTEDSAQEFTSAIEEGRDVSNVVSYIARPKNDADDRALRSAWAKKTGEELGPGSIAHVGMMGHEKTIPVSWDALRRAVAELRTIRASWKPDPGPWVFVRPAKSPFSTPQDYELVKRLEQEATAIDQLDLEAEVGKEPPSLIERRRRFLQECQTAGLFDMEYAAEREKWLDFWFATRLLNLRRAVLQLRAWGLLAEGVEPLDGSVCPDYARLQLWPPNEDGQQWAQRALKLIGSPSDGEQGAVLERVGGATTFRTWWRRDGSRAMLLAVAKD